MRARYLAALIVSLMATNMANNIVSADSLPRTISVMGTGTATAPPDMATINTGVVTQADNASAAMKENNEIMQRLINELKRQQIAAKDIQTSNFSVSPEYSRDERGRTTPEIVGYRVANQVHVQVRNLPSLGDVLDAMVKAGSNRISGIGFGIDNPEGVLNQARNRAIADARSRAQLYAQALGIKVGSVVSVSETAVATPGRQFMVARAMAESSVPIATGEQELSASIQVVFAISD